jgi:hypothetical protein
MMSAFWRTDLPRLSLKITSITEFIPRALTIEEEEENYGGFAASADKSYDIGKKRRAEEAALRSDSAKRRVVWVSAVDSPCTPQRWQKSICLWGFLERIGCEFFFCELPVISSSIASSQNVEDRADIDPAYQDADGEPDSQVPNRMPDSQSIRPIGIRQADGTILPCSQSSQVAVGVAVCRRIAGFW